MLFSEGIYDSGRGREIENQAFLSPLGFLPAKNIILPYKADSVAAEWGQQFRKAKIIFPFFSQSSNFGEFFFPCISKSETVCSPPNFDNTVLDRALATPFYISLVKYVGRRSYSFSPSPSLYPRVRVLSQKILFIPPSPPKSRHFVYSPATARFGKAYVKG